MTKKHGGILLKDISGFTIAELHRRFGIRPIVQLYLVQRGLIWLGKQGYWHETTTDRTHLQRSKHSYPRKTARPKVA